jgi:hypothetical protein
MNHSTLKIGAIISIARQFTLPLLLCTVVVLTEAKAAVVGGYSSLSVTELISYTNDASGAITFRVSPFVAGCEGGFWLSPADLGFKANLAVILLATQTKSAIRVWGHNDQIWAGSSSPTCKLYAVGPF